MRVIEFLGMPKSGKSTAIEIAESYLKKQGKRVRTVYEGARVSPLDKKDRFMYNAWSFHNTVNRILEAKLDHYDFILVDRGVHDHAVFADAIKDMCDERMHLVQEYYRMFWRVEDEALLYMLTPDEATERERKNNPFLGRVFDRNFLVNLYACYEEWNERCGRTDRYFNGTNSLEENTEHLLRILEGGEECHI